VLEQLAKDDYRDSTHPAVVAGTTLSHTEAGRVLEAAGESLHAELFAPTVPTDSAIQPAELLIVQGDGSRYRTNEADQPAQDLPADEDALSEEERKRGWRENKIGVVIRALPGKVRPEGDYQPPEELVKTCVATTGSLEQFEHDILTEAQRRGAKHAREVVAVSDNGHGLPGLWERFFAALGLLLIRITDFYHCAKRLAQCAALIKGDDAAHKGERGRFYRRLRALLWNGKVEKVIAVLRAEAERLAPQPRSLRELADQPAAHALWTHLLYFEKYKHTMDYPTCRAKGWPMGSGSVESACGQFGDRVKHNRMRWTRRGAEALHVVKAAIFSGDDRWAKRWPPPIPVLEVPAA
jgi:hypothetical protein